MTLIDWPPTTVPCLQGFFVAAAAVVVLLSSSYRTYLHNNLNYYLKKDTFIPEGDGAAAFETKMHRWTGPGEKKVASNLQNYEI